MQSITLDVTTSTSTSETITPTVFDSLGTQITGVPLTWSSSEPGSVSVSSSGGATGSTTGGGTSIIASCTPPTCNTGFLPSLPIYPENVVNMDLPPTTQPANATVYVSTTSCGTTDGCISTVVPITAPANTLGNFTPLPATPNSLVFNGQGSRGIGHQFRAAGDSGTGVAYYLVELGEPTRIGAGKSAGGFSRWKQGHHFRHVGGRWPEPGIHS